ncbi:hypothetical protein LTR53_014424 [Teratosphaeriaceae sp. CCFEE 6253]|nr:hypothetical protein LTR53_014424 [Teratosphaeriaceae sp. CCFEE 6253]
MSDHAHAHQSRTDRFLRQSGQVQNKNLWGPAKWIAQLVQYLVAIILVTIAEGFKAIVSGQKGTRRRERAAH